jgi:hypothetical protein
MTQRDEMGCVNTDKELFSEVEGDFYSPRCHMTQDRALGINVGGYVYVQKLSQWVDLIARELPLKERIGELEFNTTSLHQDYQSKVDILQAEIATLKATIDEILHPLREYRCGAEGYTDADDAIDNAIERGERK